MTLDHAIDLFGAAGGACTAVGWLWRRALPVRLVLRVALYRLRVRLGLDAAHEALCAALAPLWRRLWPVPAPAAPAAPLRERTPMYVPPSRRYRRVSPRPPMAPDHGRAPHVPYRVPSSRPSSGLSHVTASPCPRPKPRRDGAAIPTAP